MKRQGLAPSMERTGTHPSHQFACACAPSILLDRPPKAWHVFLARDFFMTVAWQLGAVGRAEHAACLILHACRYPWTFFEFSKRSLPVSFDTPLSRNSNPARALARA